MSSPTSRLNQYVNLAKKSLAIIILVGGLVFTVTAIADPDLAIKLVGSSPLVSASQKNGGLFAVY